MFSHDSLVKVSDHQTRTLRVKLKLTISKNQYSDRLCAYRFPALDLILSPPLPSSLFVAAVAVVEVVSVAVVEQLPSRRR